MRLRFNNTTHSGAAAEERNDEEKRSLRVREINTFLISVMDGSVSFKRLNGSSN